MRIKWKQPFDNGISFVRMGTLGKLDICVIFQKKTDLLKCSLCDFKDNLLFEGTLEDCKYEAKKIIYE